MMVGEASLPLFRKIILMAAGITSETPMNQEEEVIERTMIAIQRVDTEMKEFGAREVTEIVIGDLTEAGTVREVTTEIGMDMNVIVIVIAIANEIGSEDTDAQDQERGPGTAQGHAHPLVIEDPQKGRVALTWLLQLRQLLVLRCQAN